MREPHPLELLRDNDSVGGRLLTAVVLLAANVLAGLTIAARPRFLRLLPRLCGAEFGARGEERPRDQSENLR